MWSDPPLWSDLIQFLPRSLGSCHNWLATNTTTTTAGGEREGFASLGATVHLHGDLAPSLGNTTTIHHVVSQPVIVLEGARHCQALLLSLPLSPFLSILPALHSFHFFFCSMFCLMCPCSMFLTCASMCLTFHVFPHSCLLVPPPHLPSSIFCSVNLFFIPLFPFFSSLSLVLPTASPLCPQFL